MREEAVELAWIGNAYLYGARELCTRLIDDDHERSLHHFRVPLHLAYLALELFYKSGIASSGQIYPTHHRLRELERDFKKTVPSLDVPIPTYLAQLLPRDLDPYTQEMFPDLPLPREADGPLFERLRYVSGRNRVRFRDLELADLRSLQEDLDKMSDTATRLLLHLRAFV
jgi:hypothetical protein